MERNYNKLALQKMGLRWKSYSRPVKVSVAVFIIMMTGIGSYLLAIDSVNYEGMIFCGFLAFLAIFACSLAFDTLVDVLRGQENR